MSLAIAKGLKLPRGSRFSIGAVPAAIAGVAPTLDFRPALERREIEAVSLTDKLTFTGGNQGTFVGSDGYIQRAQTNVPRFTHDPVTRQSLGMKLEASGQNLLLRSEEFNQTWSPVNILAFGSGSAINAAIAPDNTTTADFIAPNTSTAAHGIGVPWPGSGTRCVSTFAKASGYNQIAFVSSSSNVVFDLTSASVIGTPVDFSQHSVDLYQNNWVRVSSNIATPAGGNINILVASGGQISFAGNGTSGLLLYGAQINPGPLTSYIPTTNAAVTRTADSAVIDGAGVITGAYTMVEKPEGCAVISGTNINLQNGFTVERVMVFPAALTAGQITAIRAAM